MNRDLAKRNYKACPTPANLKEFHRLRNAATQLVKDGNAVFLRPHLNRNIGMRHVWKNARNLGLVTSRKCSRLTPAFTADEFINYTTRHNEGNIDITVRPISNHSTQFPQAAAPVTTDVRNEFAFRSVSG